MMDLIVEIYERLIDELSIQTYRYLYPRFNLADRLTGLIGPRGVGKTTLLLQYFKNNLHSEGRAIYFSADLIHFETIRLFDFVSELYRSGGYRIIAIDEIHKYSNWSQELKNIYDAFPSLKVIFSGSSMLDIIHGSHDLTRRAVLYHLRGMSFREYLNFCVGDSHAALLWADLLSVPTTAGVRRLIKIDKLVPYFRDYLRMGYYPFVEENPLTLYEKIMRVVDKTIYEDIANFYNLKTSNLHYFRSILTFLSNIPPGELSSHNLGKHLGIDHKTVIHYLHILNEVGLVRQIFSAQKGAAGLRKPAKVFIHNTTLLNALNVFTGNEVVKGTQRELFFVQTLLDSGKQVFYSPIGDFSVEGTLFEIGGKNKTRKQFAGVDQSAFLVKDDLLAPFGNELPLHYFGFLY